MANQGIPPPADICSIVTNLFQNEKIRSGVDLDVLFSSAKLSRKQISQLVYPDGVAPLHFYILYQTNKLIDGNVAVSYLELVSFVRGRGGYIYGYYFDVHNQPPFSYDELVNCSDEVRLCKSATLSSSNYVEVYNNVNGTIVILGLNTDCNVPSASLQYSRGGKYYYEQLSVSGISDIGMPETDLIGLSANLEKLL